MPTYNILGLDVWIPDFNDLTQAVTAPLTNMVNDVLSGISNVVWPLLQNLGSSIYLLIKPAIDTLWSWIQTGLSSITQVLTSTLSGIWSYLQGLFSQIWAALQQVAGQVWTLTKVGLDTLWSGLQQIGAHVLQMASVGFAQLTRILNEYLIPLVTVTIKEMVLAQFNVFGMLGTIMDIQKAAGTTMDALHALILGQPVEFEKIMAAKLNEVINPLATIGKDLWAAYSDYIKPVVDVIIPQVSAALQTLIEPLQKIYFDVAKTPMELWPQGSLGRSLGGMIGGMMSFNAAYVAITALELLHPLKQVGLLRMIDASRALLGADVLGRLIATTIFGAFYTLPLRYEMQAFFRPQIPDTRRADQMLFEGNISQAEWRQIYAFHGWKEQHINAWYRTMFLEPSDRMIIGMIEGGEVDLDFLQKVLGQRGYDLETAAHIMRYGTKKSLSDEIAANISEIQSDLYAGQIDLSEASQELTALGIKGSQLEFRIRSMKRRLERKDVNDKIEILTAQAKAEELTVAAYEGALRALGLREPRIRALVEKEETRRKPKKELPKEKKRDLAASTYQRLFVEDVLTTEERLRKYLEELEPPYPKDRIDLLILDAKLRKAKVIAAAA
jgi:hypothetical protein